MESDSTLLKTYYAFDEEITLKPSTELIPDEYEHQENESVLLHIFKANNEFDNLLANNMLESFKSINFSVSAKNVHDLDTKKGFEVELQNIKQEAEDKSAVFLIFIGNFKEDADDGTFALKENGQFVQVKDVWNTFSSAVCPELKDKPKIFLFCTSKIPSKVQYDSLMHHTMAYEKIYDFPVESDMLIIYHRVDDAFPVDKEKFLKQLGQNIVAHSKKHDIIDLISYMSVFGLKYVPLVISTFTRKFYLTPSQERETHLSLLENSMHLGETLKKIESDVHKLHEMQKKKKDKMFSFSFRKKQEEKPKVTKKSEHLQIDGTTPARASGGSPLASPAKRISAEFGPRRRSRVSGSEMEPPKTKKPIWKF